MDEDFDIRQEQMSSSEKEFENALRSCMIAVGCRHLLGSESLIALLRRKGYTVEPVKNK